MARREVRSPEIYRVRTPGSSRQPAMHAVSRGREIPRHTSGLRRLPHERLRGNEQSQPREAGVPHDLFDVPQHDLMAAGELQSWRIHRVPADWSPRKHALHQLSRKQQLHEYSERLRLLPPEGLSENDKPES